MDIAKIRKKLKKSEARKGEKSRNILQEKKTKDTRETMLKRKRRHGYPGTKDIKADIEPAPATYKEEEVGQHEPSDIGAEIPDEEPVKEIEIIAFKIANEEYAVKISEMLEILRYQKITPVPRSPKYLKGVTFLRGRILPVIDLQYRLGLKGENGVRQKIIVFDFPKEPVGALVNSLLGVIRVPETELLQPPATLDDREKSFIEGVVKIQNRFISVLNVDELVKISCED